MSLPFERLPQRAEDSLIWPRAREVTADPELRDPQRWGIRFAACAARAADIRAREQAKRAAEDGKQDDELRAKLSTPPRITNVCALASRRWRLYHWLLKLTLHQHENINSPFDPEVKSACCFV